MRRAKTVKVPGLLKCYDAAEHNNAVYIAAQPCTPLTTVLSEKSERFESDAMFQQSVALGIHSICECLGALHKNELVHGNVNASSVMVLSSGEWRLFGLEFAAPFNEEHSIFRRSLHLMPEHRKPPELAQSSTNPSFAVHSTDAWGLGCLLFEVFNNRFRDITTTELKQSRNLPRDLQPSYVALMSANPKMRASVEKFRSESTFLRENTFVECMVKIEELSLWSVAERDAFYRHLGSEVDKFPLQALKYVVLGKLNTAVQYGASSAAVLEPILKIGSRLSDEEFGELVSPVVVTLFSSPDQFMRSKLLSAAGEYAKLLPAALVSEKIWPLYVTGFTNKSADLRELSVRALIHFAPLLSETILATDVMRFITLLQQDREGPIRTNATICLSLIGAYLPEATRAKTLANGFGRMLRDPYMPSRLAAIRSLGNTVATYPVQSIAEQLMPAVIPATIDQFGEVREAAIRCVKAMMEVIEEAHKRMPAVPPSVQKPEDAKPITDATSAPSTPSSSWWSWGKKGRAEAKEGQKESPPPPPSSSAEEEEPITQKAAPEQQKVIPTQQHKPPNASHCDVVDDDLYGGATHSAPPPKERKADPIPVIEEEKEPVITRKIAGTTSSGGGGMKLKKRGFGGAGKVE